MFSEYKQIIIITGCEKSNWPILKHDFLQEIEKLVENGRIEETEKKRTYQIFKSNKPDPLGSDTSLLFIIDKHDKVLMLKNFFWDQEWNAVKSYYKKQILS